MNPTEQLAHFSGGTNDLSMTGLWYSHKRVAQLVEAAKAEALREARDAIHRDGPDADAIRETLGLKWDEFLGTPRQEPARRVVGEWQDVKAQAKSAGQRCSACGTSEDDCRNAATACCGLCLIRAGFTHGGSGS